MSSVWNALGTNCLTTLKGHQGWVNVLKPIKEDKLLSGSYDKTIKIWDLHAQKKLHTFRGHKGNFLFYFIFRILFGIFVLFIAFLVDIFVLFIVFLFSYLIFVFVYRI